jgi:DnaJ-class molecular chaperone
MDQQSPITEMKENDKTVTGDLETECPECHGRGGGNDRAEGWIDCFHCKGAGYIPTQAGELVLNLMLHNARRIREASCEH